MNLTITHAIKEKKNIELRYHGYARRVEPHAYGRNKEGDEILRYYQTAGGSESVEREGWKLLKIREVISWYLINGEFSIRREYKRDDKAMAHIFEQL